MAEPTIPTPTDAQKAQYELIADSGRALEIALSGAEKHIINMTPALASLAIASRAFKTDLYQSFIEPFIEASQQPGMLANKMTGAGLGMLKDYQAQSRILMESAERDRVALIDGSKQAILKTYTTAADGVSTIVKEIPVPMTAFYQNAAALGEKFFLTTLNESRLYSAGIKALARQDAFDLKEDVDLATRGLGISSEAMTAIMQEEFSKTGKVTGGAMREYTASIMAAEKVTGLSSKAITSDINLMLADVNNFGNLTPAKMAALSSTIHQLGLDIKDTTQMADKFSSFESATQAISNLSMITGVAMDTTEMFMLANEDKDEFLKQMRQSLLDQGVAIENLSFQEQKALASSLGIGVRQLESFLNPMAEFTEFSADAIEAQSNDSKFQGEELKKTFREMGEVAQQALAAMTPEGLASAQKVAAQLAGASHELAKQYRNFGIELGGMTAKDFPAMAAAGQAANQAIAASFAEGIKVFEKFRAAIKSTIAESEAAKNVKPPNVELEPPATRVSPPIVIPTLPTATVTPSPPETTVVAAPMVPAGTLPGTPAAPAQPQPVNVTVAGGDAATARVVIELDKSAIADIADARIINAVEGNLRVTGTYADGGTATMIKLATVTPGD